MPDQFDELFARGRQRMAEPDLDALFQVGQKKLDNDPSLFEKVKRGFSSAVDWAFTPPDAVQQHRARLDQRKPTVVQQLAARHPDIKPPLDARKFLRDMVYGSVTPGDVALLAGSGGTSALARKALIPASRAASAALGVRGAQRVAEGETAGDRVAGGVEGILGMLGARGIKPRVVPPVGLPPKKSPLLLSAAPTRGRAAPASSGQPIIPKDTGARRSSSAQPSVIEVDPLTGKVTIAQYAGPTDEILKPAIRLKEPSGQKLLTANKTRFTVGAAGEVTDTTVDVVERAFQRGKKATPAPVIDAPATVTPAAPVAVGVDPTLPAKKGGLTVRQYSGDPSASASYVTPAQHTMLRRMKQDLETFEPARGRMVQGAGEDAGDYIYGHKGSGVADDVRVTSEQKATNQRITEAVDDLLSGKRPSNRLHLGALDVAEGYIQKRGGYSGLRVTEEVLDESDDAFKAFSSSFDDIASTPGTREPGEAGFIRPAVLARLAGGGVGGAVGGAAGDEDDTVADRAFKAGIYGTVGFFLPSLVRGRPKGPTAGRAPRPGAPSVPGDVRYTTRSKGRWRRGWPVGGGMTMCSWISSRIPSSGRGSLSGWKRTRAIWPSVGTSCRTRMRRGSRKRSRWMRPRRSRRGPP